MEETERGAGMSAEDSGGSCFVILITGASRGIGLGLVCWVTQGDGDLLDSSVAVCGVALCRRPLRQVKQLLRSEESHIRQLFQVGRHPGPRQEASSSRSATEVHSALRPVSLYV